VVYGSVALTVIGGIPGNVIGVIMGIPGILGIVTGIPGILGAGCGKPGTRTVWLNTTFLDLNTFYKIKNALCGAHVLPV